MILNHSYRIFLCSLSACSLSVFPVFAQIPHNQAVSFGSGVIINSNTIITNYHVVKGCSFIRVHNAVYDINIRKEYIVTEGKGDLAAAYTVKPIFSDKVLFSVLSPQLGDSVYALGYTYGYERGENIKYSGGSITDTQETVNDAPFHVFSGNVNQGNSGGGVFNTEGQLIGIVTAIDKQLPNFNYALTGKFIKETLTYSSNKYTANLGYSIGDNVKKTTIEENRNAVVMIDCYKPEEQAKTEPSSKPLSDEDDDIFAFLCHIDIVRNFRKDAPWQPIKSYRQKDIIYILGREGLMTSVDGVKTFYTYLPKGCIKSENNSLICGFHNSAGDTMIFTLFDDFSTSESYPSTGLSFGSSKTCRKLQ